MNIDELTLGQIREVQRLCGGAGGGAPRAVEREAPPSGRAVVVIDRGWIFAGDQSLTADGHVRLDDCVHVFKWERIGFAKMIEEWRTDAVDLRRSAPVEVPRGSIIFRVPVPAGWGLK